MATLAPDLLRTVTRAFYPVEHTLVLETLLAHSTLPDADLAYLLSMTPKFIKRVLGRLKEDGLISAKTRQEKRTDGGGSFFGGGRGGDAQNKERMTNREWWYVNNHRAIDCVKYRLHKLNEHFTGLGKPTAEKKDYSCPQCGSEFAELDVVHSVDWDTGNFKCTRCGHGLDPVPEEEKVQENESVKRLNSQLEKILLLMQRIDASAVPENDWDAALAAHKPVERSEVNPAQRIETVDMPGRGGVASSKGLRTEPEKVEVSLDSDADVKRAQLEEERRRREKEAGQNALPEWISRSTVSGDITSVGAKAEQKRRERELNGGAALTKEEEEEKKPSTADVDLDDYFAEVEKAQKAQDAQDKADEEEEDDDDDEDDFEDVGISTSAPPATNGSSNGTSAMPNGNGKRPADSLSSTGANTPALTSSNATDDERDAKRPRIEMSGGLGPAPVNGLKVNGIAEVAEGTPAASDEDEDELEFENV